MAEVETHALESGKGSNLSNRKRNPMRKNKPREMPKLKRTKIDGRMKKLFRKRVRNYNSDDEEEKEDEDKAVDFMEDEDKEDEEEEDYQDHVEARKAREDGDEGFSGDEEGGEIMPGITKFAEGCRAFRLAFKSIVKKAVHHDAVLGPVMSAQKNLMAEKLAQEIEERQVQRQNKKEKQLIAQQGHVQPEKFLDLHEKFLIGVATKGAVRLFNAVNKAQHAQKGLNSSRSKDEKDIKKRRRQAFYAELKKGQPATKARASTSQADGEEPAWAPLRDNYMLTSSKLKDWDKLPERGSTDDIERALDDSSSSDDE